jgi:GxxExxY protein
VVLSHENALTARIIGLAIEVHKHLGPGLLESAYEECLCHEIRCADITFERQKYLPVVYKTVKVDCGYRMDIVVEGKLVIEVKAVDRLMPIHEAQMLTYLRLSGCRVGLLMNFNSVALKDGLRRLVL